MRLSLGALALVLALAQAQVLYLPLDDRPPNWAPCAWGLALCPPKGAYRGPGGASAQTLLGWLAHTRGEALVGSLDALAYGGLLQTRHLPRPPEDALARLGPCLAWKVRNRGQVFLFGVIPRWDASLRARNLEVLRALSPWTGLGIYLEATWDDALRNSPAPQEARLLPYPSRPGADEAGQVLLLRALRPGLRVRVVYEAPGLAGWVTPYEGVPLEETVAGLLRSAGAQMEENPELVLYVYAGLNPRRALLDLLALLARHPVALADIARVNRGDPRLVEPLLRLGLFSRLAAYAAWGTPANNLGAALAQGGLFLEDEKGRKRRLAEAYFAYWWGEVGRPGLRAGEGLEALRARWPYLAWDGEVLELKGLRLPWNRDFEAEGVLAFRALPLPPFLAEGEEAIPP